MTQISKQTAMDIALAYREVEAAETLLEEVLMTLDRHQDHDIRDAFGRRRGGLQLGVPSGDSSHRLFDVPWEMCRPILEAHIARQKSQISLLTAKAKIEMEGGDT